MSIEARRVSRGWANAGSTGRSAVRARREREHAMLWVLNQSDGSKSLLDIARRSGLAFDVIREAAAALEEAGLLRAKDRARKRRNRTSSPNVGGRSTKQDPWRHATALEPTNGSPEQREPSHESRPVLRRSRHPVARALRHDSEAARQHRLSADPVAPDALLRALRPYRVHPLPRLSGRSGAGVLPALRGGDDATTSRCMPRIATSNCTPGTWTTGRSPSSTPACTATSANG